MSSSSSSPNLSSCNREGGCVVKRVSLLKGSSPMPLMKESDYVYCDNLIYPDKLKKSFDRKTAKYCADLITRVYSFTLTRLHSPKDAKAAYALYALDGLVVGIIFYDRKRHRAWVALRGSITETDWKVNFRFDQVPTCFNNRPSCGMEVVPKCHEGFVYSYSTIRLSLFKYLNSFKSRNNTPLEVVLTGHSSGASLATLALLDLKETSLLKGRVACAYLFSSPRTCNVDVESIGKERVPVFHIYEESDYVPVVPPKRIMMETEDLDEKMIKYENTGLRVTFKDASFSFPGNHQLSCISKNL